jgi:2-iminobutanoate/2-iminopropanoate deaminase
MEVSMNKTIIKTGQAPAAVGPYSQAVVVDGWVWISGQVALDPESAEMVGSDAATQADQSLRNLKAILQASESGLNQVVRATVYLTNMNDFAAVNEVYARYFSENFPARVCIEVSRLPLGALVEIDAIAKVAV